MVRDFGIVIFEEASKVPKPETGKLVVFKDKYDNKYKTKDHNGNVELFTSGGDGGSDVMSLRETNCATQNLVVEDFYLDNLMNCGNERNALVSQNIKNSRYIHITDLSKDNKFIINHEFDLAALMGVSIDGSFSIQACALSLNAGLSGNEEKMIIVFYHYPAQGEPLDESTNFLVIVRDGNGWSNEAVYQPSLPKKIYGVYNYTFNGEYFVSITGNIGINEEYGFIVFNFRSTSLNIHVADKVSPRSQVAIGDTSKDGNLYYSSGTELMIKDIKDLSTSMNPDYSEVLNFRIISIKYTIDTNELIVIEGNNIGKKPIGSSGYTESFSIRKQFSNLIVSFIQDPDLTIVPIMYSDDYIYVLATSNNRTSISKIRRSDLVQLNEILL